MMNFQRISSVQSLMLNGANYCINEDFMDINKHTQTIENSRKCSSFYDNLCLQFQKYYRLILMLPQKINVLLQNKSSMQNSQISNLKLLLKGIIDIFSMVSDFQIDGLSKIRNNYRIEDIDIAFDKLILFVQKERTNLLQLKDKQTDYQKLIVEIEDKINLIQKKKKKVEFNFNKKLIKMELQYLKQRKAQKIGLQNNIGKIIERINDISNDFDKQLMFYRQKLISYKYCYIQKITKISKNSKQSLMEMLTFLYQFIISKKNMFQVNKLQQINLEQLRKKEQKSNITEFIIFYTKRYNNIMDECCFILNIFIKTIIQVSLQSKDLKAQQVEIIQSLNKYQGSNEFQVPQILSSLDLYSMFLKYLSEIADRLNFSYNNLIKLQNNVRKQTEITLSLIKYNNINQILSTPNILPQQIRKKNQSQKYIDSLFEQMSSMYIQTIIAKIYKDFDEVITRIRDDFLISNPNKRKNIGNSMSISYISEINTPLQKRPWKKQLWIWKNWKKQIHKKFIQIEKLQKIIKQFQGVFQQQKSEERQIQTIHCQLLRKKTKGLLKLKSKSLSFESIDNIMVLLVPFKQIQSVDIEIFLMSQNLKIQTFYGQILFKSEQQSDIKKFFVEAKKHIDLYNESQQQKQPINPKIILSPKDINFIQKRRQQINNQLDNIAEYQKIQTILLSNTDISLLYKVIYSDNPIVIRGKQYQCFQDSLMKKYNNYNQKFGKFTNIGPDYFTGQQGITFKNCPLFSQRKIDYDHNLPKIPFLPESCHNTQVINIYWLSHQQFHVKESNFASGAPFVQNFNVISYIIVRQIGTDCEIKFHIKVVELNDFALKGVVIKKAIQQAKWGTSIMIDEIKKVMAGYKIKSNLQQNPIGEDNKSHCSENSIIQRYKKTIFSLEHKNKMLIFILAGVLVLNVIFKLIY